jgi:hypothetical protein
MLAKIRGFRAAGSLYTVYCAVTAPPSTYCHRAAASTAVTVCSSPSPLPYMQKNENNAINIQTDTTDVHTSTPNLHHTTSPQPQAVHMTHNKTKKSKLTSHQTTLPLHLHHHLHPCCPHCSEQWRSHGGEKSRSSDKRVAPTDAFASCWSAATADLQHWPSQQQQTEQCIVI